MTKGKLPDRVQLKGLDSLFGLDQDQLGQILDVRINELYPFKDHPFKVLDDDKMAQIVESVRENGILVPILVRDRPEGGYEVISGHRRKHAAEIVGLEKIPVIIKDLTDDEAIIAMVDANLQREEILPSEKAYAYKLKMDALAHQGRKTNSTSCQVGTKLRTDVTMASKSKDSARTIQRYIRLTHLITPLLDLVDEKKLRFNPAVELSYITPDEQYLLLDIINKENVIPTLTQAQQIKQLSQNGKYTIDVLCDILKRSNIKERNVLIKHDVIMQYFPADASDDEILSLIVRLLEDNQKRHGGL